MPKKPETLFKEKVIADLKEIRQNGGKIWWVKTQQVSIRGTPDLILGVSCRFIAIELKSSSKGILSPLQKKNIQDIKNAECLAFVAYPKNWKQILDIIRTYAYL